MTTSYIYSLSDPRSGDVFYVGVTSDLNRRFVDHIRIRTLNDRLRHIICDLAENKLEPKIEVLEEVNDGSVRYDRERYWILKHIRDGSNLCNISGLFYRGRRLSEETIYERANLVQMRLSVRPDQVIAIDTIALHRGTSKSDVMRDIIDMAIDQLKEPTHDHQN